MPVGGPSNFTLKNSSVASLDVAAVFTYGSHSVPVMVLALILTISFFDMAYGTKGQEQLKAGARCGDDRCFGTITIYQNRFKEGRDDRVHATRPYSPRKTSSVSEENPANKMAFSHSDKLLLWFV
ncbi:uncharacterized protein ARMOST_22022 [Armillaria ostoyae]|uniref:Uncharacterized protein n=1 Tax=Armillaria ostoyae TaxID=47428 RepID=A0A284SBP8_ARMOS|nr:uncharacterized protein ARMOST_22022 [Armillaria ostoyae]